MAATPALKLHLDKRAARLADDTPGDDDDLLNTVELAEWLELSIQWVEIARGKGLGPPFVRIAPRRIRYRRGAVRQWLDERAHRWTGEYQNREKREGRPKGSRVIDGKVVAPNSSTAED